METKVSYTKTFEKQLAKCPWFIQDKALAWIKFVEQYGLGEVRIRPGYHDEPLKGKRKDQRSIRLSRSYRLIYTELDRMVHIELLEVNKHEY